MTQRNLWQEWWIHFRNYAKETMDTYDLGVKTGNIDAPWPVWVEALREAWFEEMEK